MNSSQPVSSLVRSILDEPVRDVLAKVQTEPIEDDIDGLNPIFFAVGRLHDLEGLQICQALVNRGVDPAKVSINIRQTPLFYAARFAKVECIKFLVSAKCEPNHLDRFHQTPLFYAARDGKIDAVKKLIEVNAVVDIVDVNQQTPLFYAASHGQVATCRVLLDSGASAVKVDKFRHSPADIAQVKGHYELAAYIASYVVDVDVEEPKNTPLDDSSRRKCKFMMVDGAGKSVPLSHHTLDNLEREFPNLSQWTNIPKQRSHWTSLAKELTRQVFKFRDAVPFLYPVDAVKLGIPDYYDIITSPMDFSTIRNKLNHASYDTGRFFLLDLDQIFFNCRKYNPPGTPVEVLGTSCEQFIRQQLLFLGMIEAIQMDDKHGVPPPQIGKKAVPLKPKSSPRVRSFKSKGPNVGKAPRRIYRVVSPPRRMTTRAATKPTRVIDPEPSPSPITPKSDQNIIPIIPSMNPSSCNNISPTTTTVRLKITTPPSAKVGSRKKRRHRGETKRRKQMKQSASELDGPIYEKGRKRRKKEPVCDQNATRESDIDEVDPDAMRKSIADINMSPVVAPPIAESHTTRSVQKNRKPITRNIRSGHVSPPRRELLNVAHRGIVNSFSKPLSLIGRDITKIKTRRRPRKQIPRPPPVIEPAMSNFTEGSTIADMLLSAPAFKMDREEDHAEGNEGSDATIFDTSETDSSSEACSSEESENEESVVAEESNAAPAQHSWGDMGGIPTFGVPSHGMIAGKPVHMHAMSAGKVDILGAPLVMGTHFMNYEQYHAPGYTGQNVAFNFAAMQSAGGALVPGDSFNPSMIGAPGSQAVSLSNGLVFPRHELVQSMYPTQHTQGADQTHGS